jgi:small acid-soluble spore protein, H-type
MNSERARQIVSSPDMVNVSYGNARVYMESVNDSDQTCTVHYLDNPGKKLNVPLSSLMEQ